MDQGDQDSKKMRDRRRRFRYKPEADNAALIFLDDRRPVSALIENESFSGCCLVVLQGPPFKVDKIYEIEMTEGLTLKGQIRWIRKLGDIAIQIGVQFIE